MNEYTLISRYFAPLTENCPEALALRDDAALLQLHGKWTVTTDTLVEGVHFLPGTHPSLIARKLLRVNLSDLAAMGARPCYYTLNLTLPRACNENWVASFAKGMEADQQHFNIKLLGGDSTATPGPITLSITAWGDYLPGLTPTLRSTAQAGDVICVSGSIGDAGLGLHIAQKSLKAASREDADFLLDRHHLPQPRLKLAEALNPFVHAATDISDGLAADLTRLCHASELGANITLENIPLSPAAQRMLDSQKTSREALMSAGDDYELLFAIPPDKLKDAQSAAHSCNVPLTAIGTLTSEPDILWRDEKGEALHLTHTGYQHFA